MTTGRRDSRNAPSALARGLRVAGRHLDKGRTTRAVAVLEALVGEHPGEPEALTLLGRAEDRLGRREAAMASYRRAMAARPAHREAFLRYCRLAQWSRDTEAAPEILAAAEACLVGTAEPPLATDLASSRELARVVGAQLAMRHDLARLCLPLYREAAGDDPAVAALARALAADRLLDVMLRNLINLNAAVEYALTLVRRRWLLAGVALDPPVRLAFLTALAEQCQLNEQVWHEGEDERRAAAALAAEIEAWPAAQPLGEPALERLLLYALYRPLDRLANAAALAASAAVWPAPAQGVARLGLIEPLAEQRIAAGLKRLTPVEAASAAVRAQYEANPYPRWRHPQARGATSFAAFVRRAMPALRPSWLERPLKRVLVAGCGTGREPIDYACYYDDIEVLAVDLSAASLAYAQRQADELGLEQVRFAQADILNLGVLDERFEFISALGVLHHMDEPAKGLAVLAGLLAPDGLMRLALYSERGRSLVVLGHALIAESGLRPTAADMRRLRHEVLARPEDHPLRNLIVGGNDFYHLSGLRDYLFHVREHRFRPAELRVLIEGAGLRFLGFELMHAGKARLFAEETPGDRAMLDLSSWERFEMRHPTMVEGLYHFWCCRA